MRCIKTQIFGLSLTKLSMAVLRAWLLSLPVSCLACSNDLCMLLVSKVTHKKHPNQKYAPFSCFSSKHQSTTKISCNKLKIWQPEWSISPGPPTHYWELHRWSGRFKISLSWSLWSRRSCASPQYWCRDRGDCLQHPLCCSRSHSLAESRHRWCQSLLEYHCWKVL